MRVTSSVMAAVWALVILLAALPLSNLEYFDNFYGRSGVCLALHITNEKPNGWEYSVFIFLGEMVTIECYEEIVNIGIHYKYLNVYDIIFVCQLYKWLAHFSRYLTGYFIVLDLMTS